MEKKDIRLQLVISPSELARLDEWKEQEGQWSRSAAIRQLVTEALDARDGKRRRKPK